MATENGTRKANIIMRLSEFEMPPMQDVLIVGKRAPIGPDAAKRMVDVVSPEQYKIIKIDHPMIEAVVIRKILLNILEEEKLLEVIMEEGGKIANDYSIIKAQVNITLEVSKSLSYD